MNNKLHISIILMLLLNGCTSIIDNKQVLKNNNNDIKTDSIFKAAKLLNSDSIKNDSVNYYLIGKSFEKANNNNAAIEAYLKSISIYDLNEKSLEALALLYVKKGDLISAISKFQTLVKINPSASNYNNLGYTYYLNKNIENAKVAFEQSHNIDATYKKAINNLTLISQHNLKIAETLPAREVNSINLVNELNLDQKRIQDFKNTKDIELNNIQDINDPVKKISKNVYEIVNTNNINSIKRIDNQEVIRNVNEKFVNVENRSILNLQIINGNGQKGMAKFVAEKISSTNKYEIKIANLLPFNKSKTTLQYRSENYEDAIKIMISLKNKPEIVQNNNLPKSIGVRLILGKDFNSNMI